jgi:hypothetical protein
MNTTLLPFTYTCGKRPADRRDPGQTSDYLASGLIAASPVLSSEFFPDFSSEDELKKKQQSGDKW